MTPEDEKYYEAFFELFLTDGWKQLVDKCKDAIKDIHIEHIPDERSLRYVQGQINVLNFIADLDNVTQMEYESVKEGE